jgi:hypothetical protein
MLVVCKKSILKTKRSSFLIKDNKEQQFSHEGGKYCITYSTRTTKNERK